MKNEIDFILTPMDSILEESVMAISTVETGINTFPLCDFIMQTTFLRMTGFQEQKVKCICWVLASNDYEYRYKRFKQSPIGEGSIFEDKKTVLNDLVKQIKKYDDSFTTLTDAEKESILSESKDAIDKFYQDFGMKDWIRKAYQEYKQMIKILDKNCFNFDFNKKNKNTTFNITENFRDVFERMIKHRNRCAHNTLSYQRNLPSLNTMFEPSYIIDNYFLRFVTLLIFDNIYVFLFKKYLELSDIRFEL